MTIPLTVVIPAYNVSAYLRQAVASVASDHTQVLIVDDRSTDSTSVIADEARRGARLRDGGAARDQRRPRPRQEPRAQPRHRRVRAVP
ncbi:glycosyltransferase [Demequina litorisediminis]|uniref:glycosyltransferase n=1 Tax=Demequina litorisediminis TaxID=1849022 RepID=UPI0024E0E8E0|nr:glycosyltransferase [Demequina litorisediminis]